MWGWSRQGRNEDGRVGMYTTWQSGVGSEVLEDGEEKVVGMMFYSCS